MNKYCVCNMLRRQHNYHICKKCLQKYKKVLYLNCSKLKCNCDVIKSKMGHYACDRCDRKYYVVLYGKHLQKKRGV